MGFEELLGNERLRENLSGSIARGRVSHFYLISGPAGSGKRTLSRLLAAAILCKGHSKPCGHCGPCRKVMNGSHPDFITIDDREKKTVPVDLIRQARADIYIQPNEADRKIYLFPRAQDMGIPSQNALLKVLEEPPAYGVFILLTDNPEKLLPTVRSRCTELALHPLPESVLRRKLQERYPDAEPDAISAAIVRSGGYLGQAKDLLEAGETVSAQTEGFLRGFGSRDSLAILQTLVPMEKWKRDQAIPEWQVWLQLLTDAITCHAGQKATSPLARQLSETRSSGELMQAVTTLQKIIEYAQGNISVAAICGYLQWALR